MIDTRGIAAGLLVMALAACGGGDAGEEFAPGNSQLSPQQVDAALGPADQSSVRDAWPEGADANDVAGGENQVGGAANSADPAEDGE